MKTLLTFILILLVVFAQAAIKQQDITLKTQTGNIEGTLSLPEGEMPKTIVLIIAGSGATDRDGNSLGAKNNSLLFLSNKIVENGFATLRYDKRGIAKSKKAMTKESDLRFDIYVDDAVAWIELLREKGFEKIVIAGHSEGSLIGMLAAKKSNADAYVSLAGAAYKADIIIETQTANLKEPLSSKNKEILEKLRNGEIANEVPLKLKMLYRKSIQPYLMSWFKYDPCVEITKLTAPVLIIQGTTDLQVSTENGDMLHAAAKGSTYLKIEGVNHVLKIAPMDRKQNFATYRDSKLGISDELAKGVIQFLKGL